MRFILGKIMRQSLLLSLILWVSMVTGLKAQITNWSATYSGATTQACPNTQSNFTLPAVTGLTFSQVTRGAGLLCGTAANALNSTDWTGVDSSAAISGSDFYELNITSACPAYTLDSLRYSTQSSATGATAAFVLVSVNGGSFVPFGSRFTIGNLGSAFSFTVVGNSIQVPQGGSLRIRIYAFGASSSGGSHRLANGTILYMKTISPSATISGTTSICNGNSANLIVNLTGTGPWDIIYSDGFNSTAVNGINSNPYILVVNPTVTRTFTLASVVSVCSGLVSGNAVVTVLPSISNNLITASQTVCVGNTAAVLTGFAPIGGNGIYSYQWEMSADGINWNSIGGATSLNFNPGAATSTFSFRRIVSSGTCPASTSGKVDMLVLPDFTSNTISASQTICSGAVPAEFSGSLPTGGSGTYGYQWQSSLNNVSWSNVIGGNAQNYQAPFLTVNTYYRRVATTSSCTPITSSSISVQLDPALGNNQIGSSQAICVGSVAGPFTGTIPTGGLNTYTYLWQSSTDNLNYFDCGGGNGVGYSAGMILTNTYFRRIVNSGICPGNTSTSVFLRPDAPVSGNFIGNDQTICLGSAGMTLTGTTPTGGFGGYSYQWQTSVNASNWSNITGAVTLDYVLGSPTTSLYYSRIISSGACPPNTSAPLRVIVEAPITQNTLQANQTICNGTLAATISGATPQGGSGFYAFAWESSLDGINWGGLVGEVNTDFDPFFQSSTIRYRRLVTSGICPVSTSAGVFVVVDQPILNNTIGVDQTLCTGNTPTMLTGSTPIGGVGTFTYQWVSSTDNLNWFNHPAAVSAFLQPGVMTIGTYYRRVVSSGVCPADSSFYLLLDVYSRPGPNQISGAQTLCGNPIAGILDGSLSSGGLGGVFYEWVYSNDNVSWLSYPGGTSEDLIPDPLTQSTYFRRVLSSGACDNDTAVAVLIEYQNTPGDNIIRSNQTICAGTLPALVTGAIPSGGSGVYLYQWESSTDSIVWSSISGATLQDFQPGVNANNVWYRRVVDAGSTCIPDTQAITKVVVLTPPSAILTGTQTICESYAAQLSINLSGGSPPWNVTYFDGTSNVSVSGIATSPYVFNVTPSATTTYSLQNAWDICPGFYSGEPVVIVYQRPWAVLSNDQTICTPGSAVISITMYGPGPWDLRYSTNGAGVTAINGITSNPYILTVFPTATSSYRITEIYDGRCSRANLPNVSIVTGYSSTPPTIDFSYVKNGNTVWFTNLTTNADAYKWEFGDGGTSNLKNPYHYYFFNGNYQVKLIAYNVCNTDSIFKVVTGVSTDELATGSIPELYPNPVKDKCSIRLNEGDLLKEAEWLTMDGKVIRREVGFESDVSGLYHFDISGFAEGNYLLKVTTDKGTLVGRIIKSGN